MERHRELLLVEEQENKDISREIFRKEESPRTYLKVMMGDVWQRVGGPGRASQ